MMLRVPRRCEAQWLRCKAILRERLAPGGQVIGEAEIHSSAFALLESVLLKTDPAVISDDAAPVSEAPPPALPFLWPPNDDPIWHGLPGRRHDGAKELAKLSRKIDALVDALVGQNERRDGDEPPRRDDD
jgi:hypothetical protein